MQKDNDSNDKEMEENAKRTLNYNDRLDGYGFGEADAEAKHDEDEKGKDEEEANEYGEVDQYTFREAPIGEQCQSEVKNERDNNS